MYGYSKETGDDRILDLKFKVGQYVRIVKEKNIFEKGYTSKWLDKIYIIVKVIPQIPALYELDEISKNTIKEKIGQFYTEELQRVELPFDTYIVHKEKKNELLVEKLNTNENNIELVDKSDFIKNRLRKRK